MIRVLFVDDEIEVLNSLRRMLRGRHIAWEVAFASSAAQALDFLARQPMDVIVADILMPGTDGNALLDIVRQRYPEMFRLVLSGQSTRASGVQAASCAHQILAKPCEPERLINTINSLHSLETVLGDNPKVRKVVTRTRSLPSLPNVYLELMEEIGNPEASLEKISSLISQDIAISAKVMQLVNSAFFGLSRNITSPRQAAMLLGLETIRGLMMFSKVFSQFNSSYLTRMGLSNLWRHSYLVGAAARWLANQVGSDEDTRDNAFMAGLLHDVGKLVLVENFPLEYQKVVNQVKLERLPWYQAELKVFQVTHAQVGGYLLSLWGFPQSATQAVAYHHRPHLANTSGFTALSAVHLANVLSAEVLNHNSYDPTQGLDLEYVNELGLANRLPVWRNQIQTLINAGGEV